MQFLRALLGCCLLLADRARARWQRAVGDSWRSWSFPVQVGVLYSFLWGFGLVTRPWLGQHLLNGGFAFLSAGLQIEVGWMLVALTLLALRFPRRLAIGSTYLIAALKIADNLVAFNPFGVIFWLVVINGVRHEIDAARAPLGAIATPRLQRWINLALLALTIFAWLHPTSGTLALIVGVAFVQTINGFVRDAAP